MEHTPQPLGRLRVEGRVHALGSRGAGGERIHAPLVEGADGVARRLRGASESCGYLRGRLPAGASEKDLAAAHHESVFGAHPGLEAFALVFRQFPNKNWRFHGGNYSPSRTQPSLIMHYANLRLHLPHTPRRVLSHSGLSDTRRPPRGGLYGT